MTYTFEDIKQIGKSNGVETMYLFGFGIVFVANNVDELPHDEDGYTAVRDYGYDEGGRGYEVYGVDIQGCNKFLTNDVVEFWTIRK